MKDTTHRWIELGESEDNPKVATSFYPTRAYRKKLKEYAKRNGISMSTALITASFFLPGFRELYDKRPAKASYGK